MAPPLLCGELSIVGFRRLRRPLWRLCGALAGFSAALRHTRHTSRTGKQDGSLTSSGRHAKFSPAAARWPSRGPYDHMSAGPHSGRRRGAEAKALDRYGHNGDAIRWERLQQSDGWPQPATPWLAPDVISGGVANIMSCRWPHAKSSDRAVPLIERSSSVAGLKRRGALLGPPLASDEATGARARSLGKRGFARA